ncbi:hypothetical protein Q8W40_18570 [Vibrio penaeicida]|uniref:hypothetical protein n=1 Tax=Vibrio penaeicida TaxID=104609 RepID=UPI002733C940|nr:hypothetical protein [Vibrio penaeicida]MDP2574201.1 hypothetical protein [Vibrio penaeicida]
MNKGDTKKLLASVINSQKEDLKHYVSYSRLKEALELGPILTEEEKEVIWLSPAVRTMYLHIKQDLSKQVDLLWQQGNWGALQHQLAASSTKQTSYKRDFGHFSIAFHQHSLGWDVVLTVSPDVKHSLFHSTEVAVKDSLGNIWVKGIPDSRNQVFGEWLSEDAGDVNVQETLKRTIRLIHY